MTRSLPTALVALLVACGGSPPADETTPEGDTTTVAEGAETETTPEDAMADPCAEGEGEPCAEGVDGTRGAITEGDAEGTEPPEGEGTEGEGEGEGEGEVAEGGAVGDEPQRPWRNMVGAGRAVFDRVCGVCHPDGEEDIGPDIRGKRLTVARMTHMIRNGQGRMRPIPQRRLPDRYMDELMAYLSTLRTVTGVRRPQ